MTTSPKSAPLGNPKVAAGGAPYMYILQSYQPAAAGDQGKFDDGMRALRKEGIQARHLSSRYTWVLLGGPG